MAQEQFKIDNVVIRAPDSYKPVFATTSTEDSKRSQDLIECTIHQWEQLAGMTCNGASLHGLK